jgi:hypothetical protein
MGACALSAKVSLLQCKTINIWVYENSNDSKYEMKLNIYWELHRSWVRIKPGFFADYSSNIIDTVIASS